MSFDVQHDLSVNRLARRTLALILAGGRGSRLHELTDWRAKPAVPFGGKFRIIDFPLSNCFNSGIRRIGVLTQYKSHSLIRHLVHGWSNFRTDTGEFVEILPASLRTTGVRRPGAEQESGYWYAGTADAIYQNLDIIRTHEPDFVLVLSGDHVYKMDYGPIIAFHAKQEAAMTIACIEVPVAEAANAYGVVVVDETGRVIGFEEKPARPTPIPGRDDVCLASMGNYVFNTDFLYTKLIEDADDATSGHDFGKNVIPAVIGEHPVYAFPFREPGTDKPAYWRDVGTIDAFWSANMELIEVLPELNLYDEDWPILTHQAQLPPAKFVFDDDDGRRGVAIDSMVSGGCVISGAKLRRSLLFSNVRVSAYTELDDTVVLPGADIGCRCRIRRAVIDRGAQIEDDTTIGYDPQADRARGFRVTDGGVVLVTPDMLGQEIHQFR